MGPGDSEEFLCAGAVPVEFLLLEAIAGVLQSVFESRSFHQTKASAGSMSRTMVRSRVSIERQRLERIDELVVDPP